MLDTCFSGPRLALRVCYESCAFFRRSSGVTLTHPHINLLYLQQNSQQLALTPKLTSQGVCRFIHESPETIPCRILDRDYTRYRRLGLPCYASRDDFAPAGLPGAHSMRAWCLIQYLHIVSQGHTKGSAAYCKPAHGLVPARMVLSHGSYR